MATEVKEIQINIAPDGKEIVSNVFDANSGEYIQYKQVTGIGDSDVIGSVFIKRDGKYYARSSFLTTGTVNIKWLGAKGDTITDDTEYFRQAMLIPGAKKIVANLGDIYTVSGLVNITKSTKIEGVSFNILGSTDIFNVESDDFEFSNCEFNADTHTGKVLIASGRKGIKVVDSKFSRGFYGAYIESCTDVVIRGNVCREAQRWHIYINGGANILIESNISSAGLYDGIKVAGYTAGNITSNDNIIISNNICFDNQRDGIDCAMNNCDGLKIHNNVLINNKLHAVDIKVLNHPTESFELDNVIVNDNLCKTGLLTIADQSLINAQRSGVHGTQLGRVFRSITIKGNKLVTEGDGTLNQTHIRLSEIKEGLIEGNELVGRTGTGANGAIRIHFGSRAIIRKNIARSESGTFCSLYLESQDPDNASVLPTSNVIVYDNYLEGVSLNVIRIKGANVEDTQIYNNEIRPDSNQYSILDEGTRTIYKNNSRGFTQGNPAMRGYPGEFFTEQSSDIGTPEKWTCTSRGTTAINWQGCNQKGYRIIAESPAGSVVPHFTGEEIFDSTGLVWYKSRGVTVNNWIKTTSPNASVSEKGLVNQSAAVENATQAIGVDIDTLRTELNSVISLFNAKLQADRNSGQQVS